MLDLSDSRPRPDVPAGRISVRIVAAKSQGKSAAASDEPGRIHMIQVRSRKERIASTALSKFVSLPCDPRPIAT